MNTCRACGATENLHEEPYYDPILKRDSTGCFCVDLDTCLDRSQPEYYRKSWQMRKEREMMKTCRACGATKNLHLTPYYDPVLNKDSAEYFCTDYNACRLRSLPKYYKKGDKMKMTGLEVIEHIDSARRELNNFNLKLAEFRAAKDMSPASSPVMRELYAQMGQLDSLLRQARVVADMQAKVAQLIS